MSSAPRTRTKPCDQCREKHLKCDNETPCANCKKISISCARAKKFRIKKLITSENTFKFDPNQTWIETSNQKKSNAISFVDETNSASRHSRANAAESPSSENGSQSESLDFAASILQTLSEGNHQLTNREDSLAEAASEATPGAFGTSQSHEGFSASQDLSQLSLTSSPSGQSNHATNHYGAASVPVFSTQWQHSSPEEVGANYVNPSGTDEQSPFGGYNSQPYPADTLPSMMDLELHNPTSLLSANPSQPLSVEEACLLRCFVEKLARAVRPFQDIPQDHHYISVLPLRAVHSPLLLNAICTASARFLTRVSSLQDPDSIIEYAGVKLPDLNMESAIHYHNKCISHLMGVSADPINSCSDDALAAITILRYHEQVDTHFTGTDNETFSIAVRAVFQASQNDADGLLHLILQPPRGSDVYATSLSSLRFSACLIALRQEIWSVLMHRRPFRLPILPVESYGIFDDTLAADDYDWTNRVLIWCAHVLKFCYPDDDDEQPIDNRTRSQQCEAIKDFQRNWDEKRPPHFAPLYYRERNPSEGRYFPEYWITSPCQMLALQHIELARIVLAVHDTKIQLGIGGRAAHKALEELMREATRRVCGLAMSQKWCQEGMVTAAVGLSMCGEYFQDPEEQAAIMELVTFLERDHAWPTSTLLNKLWDT
ncbi:major facilitator superfamily transporter [Fusarium mexicanum]|uniref:Major facilitator superfamily transporter n=1 Tax=Fusarium mexicanum TaxID=751941 RepID=A0A8H5I5T2_9HYPO|nr:major facilitator superfamily transporter [Fusarium mexicanum]